MGSRFIEKHKRKSLLALLLLLLRGRGKYIALLVIVILFSIPFVATSDMIERFFGLSPVRYVVKLFGLESVMASVNPKYSVDVLKAAFDKLRDEYAQINPFMKNAGYEDRGGRGTLEYVRVGDALSASIKGRGKGEMLKGKDGVLDGRRSKDDIDGVVSSEERGSEGVDLSDVLKLSGLEGETGDLFENSGIFGKGNFATANLGRFESKDLLAMVAPKKAKGGISGVVGKNNVSADALALSQNSIPEVKTPVLKRGKVRVSRSGSLTAFGWKNVGYTKNGANLSVNITGNRRALFQMGETMATTSMAYKQNPAYEYQAAYVGSTYDGNSLNGNIVATSADSNTSVPDTGYISTVVDSAQEWEKLAKECSDAQATHGTRISKLQDEIDDILKNMGKPPKCCSSSVHSWNKKVSLLVQKCNELNVESQTLGQKCQNSNPQIVNCQQSYGRLYIKPCSKKKCWLGLVFGVIGFLIGFLIGGFIGAIIGAAIGFAIGQMASIYLAMAGMGAAFAGVGAYFANDKSKEAIKTVEDVNKDVRENH